MSITPFIPDNAKGLTKPALCFVLLFLIQAMYGQEDEFKPKYGHYRGSINEEMQLVADLFFTDSIAKGYYYYYFKMPGEDKVLRYSPSIPLSGKLYNGNIELREFGDGGSVFRGKIMNDTIFSGVWIDNKSLKSLAFSMEEDYSNGSVPLTAYYLTGSQKMEGNKAEKIPRAKIELSALVPAGPNHHQIADSILKVLSAAYGLANKSISNPGLFLQQIRNEYFQFYQSTTEGISHQNQGTSFDWEKKMNMEIVYNQHELLCIQFRKYVFTGGSQGLEKSEFMVFSGRNGKRLNLDDIFMQGSKPILDSLLNVKIRGQYAISPDKRLKEEGFFVDHVEASRNFYLNKDGIGFYFNTYVIASSAKGAVDVFIPFSQIENILKKDYLGSVVQN